MHSMRPQGMHGIIACLACLYIVLESTQGLISVTLCILNRTYVLSSTLTVLQCLLLVAAATSCIDVVPPGNYTCAEQKAFGKCTSPWMVQGKFCEATCGVCSSAPSSKSAAPVGEPNKSTSPSSQPSSPPKSETQAQLLAAANSLTSPTSKPDTVVALPDLSLPSNINVPSPPLGYVAPPPMTSSSPGTTTSSIIANVYSVPSPQPQPQKPAASTTTVSPAGVPGMEAVPQTTAAKGSCNATSAWDVLSSDPELSIFTQAAAALNLTGVLKNANINFTARVRLHQMLHIHFRLIMIKNYNS